MQAWHFSENAYHLLPDAKEHLRAKLCPAGCEEREDLQNAINAKSASN